MEKQNELSIFIKLINIIIFPILSYLYSQVLHMKPFRKKLYLCAYHFAVKQKTIAKTFYQVLELRTSASQKEVKQHYIKLAKIYHPDVYKGSDKKRFQQIKQAFDVLHNVEKRKSYDRTIGISSKEQEDEINEQKFKQESAKYQNIGKKPKVKLDYSFSKTEAESMDLDEKYNQFFNKKVETPFQEIRIKQNSWWNEMTEKERLQKSFTTIYNNPKHQIRTAHQDKYPNILEEQIKQRNRYEDEVKKAQQNYEKKNSPESITKAKRKYYLIFGILGLITFPLIASIATREKIIREEELKIINILEEMKDLEDEEDVKRRLQY